MRKKGCGSMVGYVSVNMEELKIKEYREYKGWYCGLCEKMGAHGGVCGRMTLSYDMTFLYMLLASLYDEKVERRQLHCPLHPLTKHLACESAAGEYVADMGILLRYYDLLDDWADERKAGSRVLSAALRERVREISVKYPKKFRAVRRYVKRLSQWEKMERDSTKETGLAYLDKAAGFTGEMLGEIFVYKKDLWEDVLRRMGFYLGKFIYLMDAWRDVEKDEKTGNYNPFLGICREMKKKQKEKWKEAFDKFALAVLEKMAAECCRAFEVLPVVENVEILRNVLYSGIWAKDEKKGCKGKMEGM